MNILFFGSTSDSVIVLEKLAHIKNATISAVVTQPPKPIGRDQIITPTPVETWAKNNSITVLAFDNDPQKPWKYTNEQVVIDALQPIAADVLISASYGQMIPWETISAAQFGGINIHPSILPHWRGADPVPWAIMNGDHQIGVSVVTLSKTFDEGKLLAQEKIPIDSHDTSDPLRTKLFAMGADLLAEVLPLVFTGKIKAKDMHMPDPKPPYARKFTRDDGFEPWERLALSATEGTDADVIDRKFRALDPWPGLWTKVTHIQSFKIIGADEKRLKIRKLHLSNAKIIIDEVQLEGKKPTTWEQFNAAYRLI